MAIAVIFDFAGGTTAQYDEIIKKMGLKQGGPGGPGGLFHWATKTDQGLRVTDVWRTKEAFEKFSAEKIEPFVAAAGMPQPTVQFHEVYSYLTSN